MKHVFIVFFVNGIVSVFSLFLLNQLLGQDGYARHSYFVSFSLVINAIFFQWIRLEILRAHKSNISEQQKNSFMSSTVNISFVLLIVGMVFFYQSEDAAYFIAFLTALSMGVYEILLAYTRLTENGNKFTKLNFIRSIAFISGLLILYQFVVDYVTTLIVLASSYFLATLYFSAARIGRASNLNIVSLSDIWQMIKKAVYPAGIVICVMIGYYVIKLFAQSMLIDINFQIYIFYYDLFSLSFLTIFLAFNYLYQSNLVNGYDSNDVNCFEKAIRYVAYALVLSLVGVFILAILSHCNFFGYLERRIDVLIIFVMAKGLIVHGIKLQWLDHAYYLTKRYKSLAAVNLISVLYLLIVCSSFEQLSLLYYSLVISSYFCFNFILTLYFSWRDMGVVMYGRLMTAVIAISIVTDILIWIFYGKV